MGFTSWFGISCVELGISQDWAYHLDNKKPEVNEDGRYEWMPDIGSLMRFFCCRCYMQFVWCWGSLINKECWCLQSMCELPESYEAYRKQQHRWHSGPMQLFRLCLPDIITSKVGLLESLLIGLCPCQVQSLPWYFKSALRESYDIHSDFSLALNSNSPDCYQTVSGLYPPCRYHHWRKQISYFSFSFWGNWYCLSIHSRSFA